MLLVFAAVIPVVYIAYLIYRLDTEKEPLSLLWKCFSRGMLIAIPAIAIEMMIDLFLDKMGISGSVRSAGDAFAGAALTEEGLKFFVTYKILTKTKYFDQFYDGIVYAVFVSLGFALVENIGYVLEHGLQTALIRGLVSVPGHAFFGVFMGYYLSKSFLGNPINKVRNLYMAIGIPIVLHGLFDFFLMDAALQGASHPWAIPIYMISFFALNIWFWRHGRRRVKELIALDKLNILKRNGDQDIA